MRSLGPSNPVGEARYTRIVTAALEVFSKSSFGDATTDEIARRARVSKRDLYAEFPDKHALLAAVISTVLESGDQNLQQVISDSQKAPRSLRERLEIVGLALMTEILSPLSGFVSRLVSSESIEQPPIGAIYFENWYTRRSQLVAQVLAGSTQRAGRNGHTNGNGNGRPRKVDTRQAARHFVALITHLPQLTACVGKHEVWTPRSVQAHVRDAVDCLLKAYPALG